MSKIAKKLAEKSAEIGKNIDQATPLNSSAKTSSAPGSMIVARQELNKKDAEIAIQAERIKQLENLLEQGSRNVVNIPLDQIDQAPAQPRKKELTLEMVEDLMLTLPEAGIDEPIRVRKTEDGRYQLIAGHRRKFAAEQLNWTEIPAIIVETDERTAALAALLSNSSRKDISDYDLAHAFSYYMEDGYFDSQAAMGKYFGYTRQFVSDCMAILKLPKSFLDVIEKDSDKVSNRLCLNILRMLDEKPEHKALILKGLERIVHQGAAQNSIESWVNQQIANENNKNKKRKGPLILADSKGKTLYSIKTKDRDIVITVRDVSANLNDITEEFYSFLSKKYGQTQ